MRALLGGVPAAAGAVRVAGRALEAWNRRALARHAAAVPQLERPAFPVSVRDFVALGRYPHLGPLGRAGPRDAEAVERALARCDAADLARRDVTTLSGGELQRVRIARALAQEPETLLLDEPTASLDVGHEMAILELLRASADGGLTVLLVTHHLNAAARFADQILLLDAGRVAAEGAPQTVLRRDTLERVYRWPMETGRDPHTGALTVSPLPARGRLHGEDAESP
ncbi:MAG: ABC transporter ATP-binding protein [Gemmatimonadetes bacterium]|nr:MAG: ABC transporter ATP-binding protein [Gemmatimonadota bacterium]